MFTQGRIRVLVLLAADAACIGVAWFLSVCGYWLLGRAISALGVDAAIGSYSPAAYLSFWPVIFLFAAFNALFDLYHGNLVYPAAPLPPVEEMRRLFGSSILTHLCVFAYLVFAYQTTVGVSRIAIALSGVLTALGAQSMRNCFRHAMFKLGIGQIPVVLAGGGALAQRVATAIADDPYSGLRIVGYFDGASRGGRGTDGGLSAIGIPRLGSLRDIVPVARRLDVKMLLACQGERLFRLQMEEFSNWFMHIEFIPTADAFPIFGARAVSLDGLGGLEMVNQGRMRMTRFNKRVMDDLFAVLAFFAFLPVFVVVPVLVKLTSRGPVFYRHRRLGRAGRPIHILKFRTMYVDADERLRKILAENPAAAEEWERNFKLKNDPRVTPLGRLLRKTSLDEMPQLFNVLSGEMALVGPRPIVEEEKPYYGDRYELLASVKPGMTGLWQVSGRSETDYARRVALDAQYILNWSPWMDIWILFRTVVAVLTMRGSC